MAVREFKTADGRFINNATGFRYGWELPAVKDGYILEPAKMEDLVEKLVDADIKLLAVSGTRN
jgi:hypothetical protein